MSDRPAATDCPDPAELTGFVSGELPKRTFERIARHVEHSRACELTLERLDNPSNALLSGLRQVATGDLSVETPIPPDLLAAARTCFVDRPDLSGSRTGKFELLEELGIGS